MLVEQKKKIRISHALDRRLKIIGVDRLLKITIAKIFELFVVLVVMDLPKFRRPIKRRAFLKSLHYFLVFNVKNHLFRELLGVPSESTQGCYFRTGIYNLAAAFIETDRDM